MHKFLFTSFATILTIAVLGGFPFRLCPRPTSLWRWKEVMVDVGGAIIDDPPQGLFDLKRAGKSSLEEIRLARGKMGEGKKYCEEADQKRRCPWKPSFIFAMAD